MFETETNDEVETSEGYTNSRQEVADKYARRRVRHGKTKRDHESGAWRRRLDNQTARGEWINETRPFPPGRAVPAMITPHGLGNSSKRFKVQPGKKSKG